MGRKIKFFLLLLLLLFLFGQSAAALSPTERILNYWADIIIQSDSSMTVTEVILVASAGQEIRHGIYRDFPTTYKDKRGNRVRVEFSLLSVTRDGNPEPYSTERKSNGIRIRIGREDAMLSAGQHAYAITYKVKRVLGFFSEHDELYWNVTGNGWSFVIEGASATVSLPPGAPTSESEFTAFTGFAGATGKDYNAYQTAGGVDFHTTRALLPGEGLTIVVGWPKGYVAEPSFQEKLRWFLRDNIGFLFAALALILPVFWYLFAWHRVGRDPQKGIIIPRYTPPEGLSPGAVRYVWRMGYDDKAFSAAVINLAVQGRLTISQNGKKKFSLHSTAGGDPCSLEEETLHKKLFYLGETVELTDSNHTLISSAIRGHEKQLSANHDGIHFITNSSWLLPGIFGSLFLAALGVVFSVVYESHTALFFLIPAAIATFFIAAGFAKLLQAPTYDGRILMDEIEGFRLYLEVAEKDYLQCSATPERTPELFERYLPYALALGVQQQWAEKFSTVLAAASQEGQGYSPTWYQGYHFFSVSNFTNNLSGSLNTSISAAKTAPGSSSGFSGGSSGGGGGGGGGGGW